MVFRTLPSFLPSGVGASVGCSALRPAAACALFPGYLSEAVGFGGFLGSLLGASWPWVCFQVHLTGSVPCQHLAF